MSIATEIAQDRADAAREQAEQTVAELKAPDSFVSEARSFASRCLKRTQTAAKDVSGQTAALVKSNPIKTAALGAAIAGAAGVAIGFFATRLRA